MYIRILYSRFLILKKFKITTTTTTKERRKKIMYMCISCKWYDMNIVLTDFSSYTFIMNMCHMSLTSIQYTIHLFCLYQNLFSNFPFNFTGFLFFTGCVLCHFVLFVGIDLNQVICGTLKCIRNAYTIYIWVFASNISQSENF